MRETKSILGCFVSSFRKDGSGPLFTSYVWGENSISERLSVLMNETYGNDMELILLQFYVNPIPYLRQQLKEIEGYRKKEKSIGIPIIVNDENFFSKSEAERFEFLKQSILQKLDLLAEVVKKKKLDTNIQSLKEDVERVLSA
ncbi:MAG: hypothetical protein IPN69_18910 [Acidobacteria bacterium]|nr:hypothetical protein [Acidobacteriota bacterium]